jgi:hypothetical protein
LARAESALAGEREKRQSLAGEANAFKAVNASQRAQLDELLRAALTPKPKAKKPAHAADARPAATSTPPATEKKVPALRKKPAS